MDTKKKPSKRNEAISTKSLDAAQCCPRRLEVRIMKLSERIKRSYNVVDTAHLLPSPSSNVDEHESSIGGTTGEYDAESTEIITPEISESIQRIFMLDETGVGMSLELHTSWAKDNGDGDDLNSNACNVADRVNEELELSTSINELAQDVPSWTGASDEVAASMSVDPPTQNVRNADDDLSSNTGLFNVADAVTMPPNTGTDGFQFKSPLSVEKQTFISDDDDHDDFLMPVNVNFSGAVPMDSVGSSEELETLLQPSPVNTKKQYNANYIDSILRERSERAAKNFIIEEIEKKLKSGNIKAEIHEGLEEIPSLTMGLEDIPIQIKQCSEISNTHPGLELFDLNKCFHLYGIPYLAVTMLPPPTSRRTKAWILTFKQSLFEGSINKQLLDESAEYMFGNKALVMYVWQLMSVHPDCSVSRSSMNLLRKVATLGKRGRRLLVWAPLVTDVAAAFVNYGADLNDLFPYSEKLRLDRDCLQAAVPKQHKNCNSEVDGKCTFPLHNLIYVVESLLFYILDGLYSDDDLEALFVMLSLVGLDKHLIHFNTFCDVNISSCLNAILLNFSDTYWDKQVPTLAKQLVTAVTHHHNMVFTAHRICGHDLRHLQMQKMFSFHAVHRLLHKDVDMNKMEITPMDVLELLSIPALQQVDEMYLLYSILGLLDICIVNEPLSMGKKMVDELKQKLMKLCGKIKETIHCLDISKVKEYTVRIVSRLTLIGQYGQRTLFDYNPSDYNIREIGSGFGDEDDKDSGGDGYL